MALPAVAVFGFAAGVYLSEKNQAYRALIRPGDVRIYGNLTNTVDTVGIGVLFSMLAVVWITFRNEPVKLATFGSFALLGFAVGKMYSPRNYINTL